MRVLITGAKGYIGPVVVKHLRTVVPEASLVGMDIGLFAFCDAAFKLDLDELINFDIRDFDITTLGSIDAVVHLAAISNDPIGNKFKQVTEEINYQSTVNLARTLKQQGCRRFVFASSCSVYGFSDSEASESSALTPLTDYAISKARAEAELQTLADDSFQVTCLRFATACGYSPGLRLDLVLNDFVARAFLDKKISILSDGKPWRPLIHIKDMARAIEWALSRNGPNCLIVNAGSDVWNYQVIELAEAVAQNIPGISISINPEALPDRRSYRVSFSFFRDLAPAHQPQMQFNAVVNELVSGLSNMRSALGRKDLSFDEFVSMHPQLIRLKGIEQNMSDNKISPSLRILN